MSVDEDLLEAPAQQAVQVTQEERRRPGRMKAVAPGLIPLLRDPTHIETADRASPIFSVTLALIVVGLCTALGYAMRGAP